MEKPLCKGSLEGIETEETLIHNEKDIHDKLFMENLSKLQTPEALLALKNACDTVAEYKIPKRPKVEKSGFFIFFR